MSVVNFVNSVFANECTYNKPARISEEDARINIAEWKNERMEVPPALTPALLSELWNNNYNDERSF